MTSLKSMVIVFALALVAGVLAARVSGDPGGAPEIHYESSPAWHVVEMKNGRFEPPRLDIQVGDFVTWINKDEQPHSALRTLAPAFDTGLLATDKTCTVQFTVPSAGKGFEYSCLASPQLMRGLIIVRLSSSASREANGAGKESEARNAEPPAAMRMPKTFIVYVNDQEPFLEPRVVEIQAGDSVRWINESDLVQTASRERTPAFETGPLTNGGGRAIRFDAPTSGEGIEYCSRPHPYIKGRVVVKLPGSFLAGEGPASPRERVTKSTAQAEASR